MRRFLAHIVLALVLCSTAWAAESPVAVSPGDASELSLIGDVCPTFSWTEVTGADRYDLVIYRVGEDEGKAEELLRHAIPGGANGWTPSLDRCLDPGGRYAWSVRAVGVKSASEWSAPSLFEVALGPSQKEFEEAVAVVRRYLTRGGEIEEETAGRSNSSSETSRQASAEALPPAATQLTVDGNVHATSFSGDGTGLTGVDADLLDSFDSQSFMRSDTSDAFTSGTLSIDFGTVLDVNGTLRMDGFVFKNTTTRVDNLNADFLDGLSENAFFRLSQNETVSGRPAFNGGASGASAPFTVDSNFVVSGLNADFVDGFNASGLVKTTQIQAGKIQNSPSSASALCPSVATEVFSPAFTVLPVVVLTPEGVGMTPEGTIGNSYCVIDDVTTSGFTHCCYGHNPRELHWIAISAAL